MKNYPFTSNSFIIDNNNIMWSFEYDMLDNSVVITSDDSNIGEYAVVSQYSMDSSLSNDIPDSILGTAQAMIEQDAVRISRVIGDLFDNGRSEEQGAV
jgi:hypothetical protein